VTSTSTAHAISPDSGQHWTAPGAWPVADGVHRIPLPLPTDGLKAVNVYAIETDHGLTLVDAGWALEVSRDLLESSLRGAGFAMRDITRFLVTHVHRDHYTQAVTVRRDFGSHISLGVGDQPTLDLINSPTHAEGAYVGILVACGARELAEQWRDFTARSTPDLSHWEYPDTWLDEDQVIEVGTRSLEAISTPGHTQGHFVFADRAAGLLFAGDHVLPTITPSIGFEPVPPALPLGDYLASLTKVRRLDDLVLLPAHGPVAPSSHARIDELVEHHDVRLRLCDEAVAQSGTQSGAQSGAGSGRTAQEVASGLPWTRHAHAFADLDVFNAALATLETRAHLELLVAQGSLIGVEDGDGAVRYVRAGRSIGA